LLMLLLNQHFLLSMLFLDQFLYYKDLLFSMPQFLFFQELFVVIVSVFKSASLA
jgi:hypothetical protein